MEELLEAIQRGETKIGGSPVKARELQGLSLQGISETLDTGSEHPL